MIFQTWQTYNEFTGGNGTLSDLLIYPANVWSGWIPLLLFGFYLIVLFASYYSSKRFGEGNFAISLAVAGWLTMIISFIMMLIPNLINLQTIIICIVVSLIGTIILLLSKEKY